MGSLLVRDGVVVDGTGEPRYCADVRIVGGRIADVGYGLTPRPGDEALDAHGLIVSPGFVAAPVFADAGCTREERLLQGITTEISAAVPEDAAAGALAKRLINKGLLIPLASLEMRAQTEEGMTDGSILAAMAGLLAQELERGAFGLAASAASGIDEVSAEALCQVLEKYGGMLALCTDGSDDMAPGVLEMAADAAGVQVDRAPLGCAGVPDMEECLEDGAKLPLEEGVCRLSGEPCQRYQIRGRGRLRPGYRADLCIFEKPKQGAAARMHYVLVDGVLEAAEGQVLKDRGGQSLSSRCA
ncbi:MAG: hypothetical protein ACI361_09090 [Atopobiaceae bacterium]